ncbi:MAG: hypothetical protein MR051_07140 [Lentisphaeria bacterium]|nr:hypothetical protein [Lentisphaeria bacterium]
MAGIFPTEDKNATDRGKQNSRPDFGNRSALGPISRFIEDMPGIREIDAPNKRVCLAFYPFFGCGDDSSQTGNNVIPDSFKA